MAGSAAAIELARAGREVVLLEASRVPVHKVCGEFLSAEALGDLRALGVEVEALGGVRIGRVRVGGRKRHAVERALPFRAMSLTRRRLDEAMLARAGDAGVELRVGCRATEVVAEGGAGWRVRLQGGGEVRASEVVIASGKHDLNGRPRPEGTQSGMLGLKMYLRLTAEQARALGEAVELVVFGGGYAGLQPVEDGVANLCCAVRAKMYRQLGGRWDRLVEHMGEGCATLRDRLRGAEALLDRPLAVAAVPYGFVRQRTEGPWYVGDQAAVIPSFTGDGMSIALYSGRRAAAAIRRGEPASVFQAALHAELAQQVWVATAISRGLVNGWTQPMLLGVARLWPPAVATVARATRISAPAHAVLG